MNKPIDKMEEALETLILRTLEVQEETRDKFDVSISQVCRTFLDEFCIVQFRGARRAGHTTTMIKVAKKMFKKPMFVFHNKGYVGLARKELGKNALISTFDSVCRDIRGIDCDAVFVDIGSVLLKDELEAIKEAVFPLVQTGRSFVLVLVG